MPAAKSTLIYLAPLALGVAVADWRRRRDTAGSVAAAAIPALLLLPWLIFNLDHYDALTASSAARDQQAPVVNPLGLDYGTDDVLDRTGRLLKEVLPAEWWAQLDVPWVRVATLVLFGALFGVALALAVAPPPGWSRRPLWFFAVPVVCGYATLVVTMLAAQWPSFNLRYLYPVLPALAVAVGSAFAVRGTRWAWRGLVVCAVLLAAVWIDMAGAFYFTDVGDTLGI